MERRGARRISRRLACEFEVEGRAHRGFILNLSRDGAYLQTEAALTPGTELGLHVSAAGFPDCDLRGRVARRLLVPGPLASVVRKGVGISLIDPPEVYLRALDEPSDEGPEIEIEVPVGDFDDEPAHPRAEPRASGRVERPSGIEIMYGDPGPESDPDGTEVELSEEEWDALDPLGPRALVEQPGRSVLDVETLLVGEGELDDVAILLDELGENPVRMTAEEATQMSRLARPPRIIVISARSAMEVRLDALDRARSALTLAVAEDDSFQLVNLLRRQGFDFVVRRPVDPDALRLLLARLTYRGGERRGQQRTPIGCEVKLLMGLRRRPGFLLEVSEQGCSLLCPEPYRRGTRLRVRIPRKVTGGRPLSLSGRVVRLEDRREPRPDRRVMAGLAFDRMSEPAEKRLALLIQDHLVGPARLERRGSRRIEIEREIEREHEREHEPANVLEREREERRQGPRLAVRHEAVVVEGGEGPTRVLFGTELSQGGMRIEPHPELGVGDRVDLILHAATFPAALRVAAEVLRDEGDHGLALGFITPDPAACRALARIMDELPTLLGASDDDPGGLVMTEITAAAGGASAA